MQVLHRNPEFNSFVERWRPWHIKGWPGRQLAVLQPELKRVMAAIYKEIEISVASADVWAAIRDYGAIHRIVPQIECRMDGDARIIIFPDGRIAREVLVGIDDEHRRLVYAEPGGRFITRNGAMQVVELSEGRCRLVWTNDLLPDAFAAMVAGNMDRGLVTMKQNLEAGVRAH
jgi:hypothetical protein